ncbi:MAG: hypothetical protein KF768_05810 [Phycisphaeraceae bacterium]|nr:hypothetical protein [Phycisphaeraceae bacterium]
MIDARILSAVSLIAIMISTQSLGLPPIDGCNETVHEPEVSQNNVICGQGGCMPFSVSREDGLVRAGLRWEISTGSASVIGGGIDLNLRARTSNRFFAFFGPSESDCVFEGVTPSESFTYEPSNSGSAGFLSFQSTDLFSDSGTYSVLSESFGFFSGRAMTEARASSSSGHWFDELAVGSGWIVSIADESEVIAATYGIVDSEDYVEYEISQSSPPSDIEIVIRNLQGIAGAEAYSFASNSTHLVCTSICEEVPAGERQPLTTNAFLWVRYDFAGYLSSTLAQSYTYVGFLRAEGGDVFAFGTFRDIYDEQDSSNLCERDVIELTCPNETTVTSISSDARYQALYQDPVLEFGHVDTLRVLRRSFAINEGDDGQGDCDHSMSCNYLDRILIQTIVANGGADFDDDLYDPCLDLNFDGTIDASDLAAFDQLPTCCPEDVNGDGVVDLADLLDYLGWYNTSDPRADFNGDGTVDLADYLAWLGLWQSRLGQSCP